ncbi:ATP-binding protein [Lachnospiraceae bacterium ZAX-1]
MTQALTDDVDVLQAELKKLRIENKKLARELKYEHTINERNKISSEAKKNLSKIVADEKSRLELYMNLLLGNCPDIILLFDCDGKIMFTSEAYLKLSKISAFSLISNKTYHELLKPVGTEEFLKRMGTMFQTALVEKRSTETEENIDFGRGDYLRHYHIQVTPMLGEDKDAAGMMIFCYDTTDLTNAKLEAENAREMAEESTRAKSDFLSRMSHEIRTPMNSIVGMSELALRENVSPAVEDYILEIKAAGANLLSIINDILDFSKIESGNLQITRAGYMFASLLNDVVNLIKVRIAEKPILFLVNVDPNIPGRIIGDEVRVRQILTNLLSNAAKYTNEGFIKMSVVAEFIEDYRVMFKFTIEDSGIGIREEDLQLLFNEFVRVDMNSNKNVVGTGLGLSITQSLCRAMGGDIVVSSEYGKGSAFVATLEQECVSGEKLATVVNAKNKHVLLYERKSMCADSIAYTLNGLGVTTTCANSAGSFLNWLASGKYDFAFFPINMAEEVVKIVGTASLKTEPVALLAVGESLGANINRIIMPAFAIPVANILNGITTSRIHDNYEVRFIAPSVRTLIVDDIETNLKVAKGLFAPYQLEIDTCLSGREAVKLLKNANYDIVFMDHMMPDMDGVEATAKIRAMDGSYFKKLPIIALTANAVVGMREMFLENGFTDFLAKPIELQKLNKIMEQWIPKEKRFKADETMQINDGGSKERTLPDIDGLDVAHGILMTGGSEENYTEVLKLFSRDARARINVMQDTAKDEGADLILFATNAHALKSAAASIGASAVSEMAKELELAGKSGDTKMINEKLRAFLEELKMLAGNIECAVNPILDAQQSDGAQEDIQKISEEDLTALRESLKTDDISAADELLSRLGKMKLSEKNQEILAGIEENVLIFDIESAIEDIDKLS